MLKKRRGFDGHEVEDEDKISPDEIQLFFSCVFRYGCCHSITSLVHTL